MAPVSFPHQENDTGVVPFHKQGAMTQRNTGIAAETAAPTFSDLPKLPADQVVARSSIARNRSFHGRRVQTGAGQTIAALGLLAIITLAVIWALRHTPWYQEWHYARLSLPSLQRLRGDRTDDPRLLYHIGRRLNQQERFGEADPLLRIAVGLEPEEPRLRDEWARALLGSGRITAAFGQLREFAGKNPGSAQAHLLLGKFYFTQHSLPRALRSWKRQRRPMPTPPRHGLIWRKRAAA
jgi:Flp pilus assembly protein TadD